MEELILGCAEIHLESEQSFENAPNSSQDLSQDQTFASATDESPFHTSDCSLNEDLKPDNATGDETQVIEANSQIYKTTYELNETHIFVSSNSANDAQLVTAVEEHVPQIEEKPVLLQKSDNTANKFETFSVASNEAVKDSLSTNNVDNNQLNVTTTVIPNHSVLSVVSIEKTVENNRSTEASFLENLNLCPRTEVSVPSTSDAPFAQHTESSSLLSTSNISSQLEDTDKTKEESLRDLQQSAENPSSVALSSSDDTDKTLLFASPSTTTVDSIVVQTEKGEFVKEQDSSRSDDCAVSDKTEENSTQLLKEISIVEQKTSEFQEHLQTNTQDLEIKNSEVLNETQTFLPEDIAICNETPRVIERNPSEAIIIEKEENTVNSATLVVSSVKGKEASFEEDFDRTLTLQEIDLDFATASDEDQYAEFKPQRQSTTLSLVKQQPDFEELRSTVEEVTNDLLNPSPEPVEETDQFVSATSESKYNLYFFF